MKLVDYNTVDVLTILSKVKIFLSGKIEGETVEFKDFFSEKAVKSLQNYDWSADNLYGKEVSLLEGSNVKEAINKYYAIQDFRTAMKEQNFLEAIEVTKNGILTKGELLFLGKTDAIRDHYFVDQTK